jgi:hypothetical protein
MGGYNLSYDGDTMDVDASRLKLDPITVAGSLKVKELRKATEHQPTLRFASKGFSFIQDEHFVDSIRRPNTNAENQHVNTAHKWTKHLADLVAFTIIVAVVWSEVKSSAKYFGVPKNDEWAQAIFMGNESARISILHHR